MRGGGEMMKKLILVLALMVLASAAYATQDDWTIYLNAGTTATTQGQSAGKLLMGTTPTALDGWDAANDGVGNPLTTSQAYARIYTPIEGSPAAPDGYLFDFRHPLGASAKTWDITIGAGSQWSTSQSIVQIRIWNPAGFDLDPLVIVSFHVVADPTGILSDFTFDPTKNGSSTAAAYKFDLPAATLKAGGQIQLQMCARIVPEPGSIVAMLSGLIGLAGYGIRRRK